MICCSRSVGFEPSRFTRREQDILLARMVPFVVPNYNAVELGPRGTGKSHLFQQISPYAHLVSGGKATIANMFVNNATGRRGLVAQYDVVCFDEISGVSFDTKEGVNILKGYMESGEFSRGKESIRAEGGIVMVGNFDVDVQEELRRGHLFGPMPKEMRDDTAFHDRIHAYLPGWDVPKLDPSYFTEHFGFVSDFLAECWSQLRRTSRLDVTPGPARVGKPAQRPRPQGGQQHGQRPAEAAVAESGDGGARRRSGLGGRAGAGAAPTREGAAGVDRRRRVRQGRPQLPARRQSRASRVLRGVAPAPAARRE